MKSSACSIAIRLSVAIVILSLTACGGSSKPGAPGATEHLYVGNDAGSASILQFTLPITSASTPSVTVAPTTGTANLTALALDAAGDLATADNAGHLAIFKAPITSSSTASATFSNGTASNDGQLAFNTAGALLAATVSTKVNVFNPPLSNTSTPAQSVTDASLTSAIGAALDSSGNLVVSNAGSGSSTLTVFAPPFSNASVVTPAAAGTAYRKVALNTSQLFVASVAGTTGQIDVYNLPLSASSAPVFSMTNVNVPEALAFDSHGNLYVGNLGDATIRVFTPPFSASSTPSVTLTVTGAAIFGIAIGK
jgi:hypothetical protein